MRTEDSPIKVKRTRAEGGSRGGQGAGRSSQRAGSALGAALALGSGCPGAAGSAGRTPPGGERGDRRALGLHRRRPVPLPEGQAWAGLETVLRPPQGWAAWAWLRVLGTRSSRRQSSLPIARGPRVGGRGGAGGRSLCGMNCSLCPEWVRMRR